ncbi:HTH tetR-type domain-containing protein [Bordetella sputigena]|uniref:TetR/AcrR family transcriptional regulator n=1 Tax=Bordetella sputigena TaxID=1416810 RepID=UPI0039F10C06
MRKSREEAARTRERIVVAAGQAFRRDGIAATGLAGLMHAAGLTHGGFYKHFSSKEELVAEACGKSINRVLDDLVARVAKEPPERRLAVFLESYLSATHRDSPENGCGLAALGSELSRAGDAARAATTRAFERMADIIVQYLPEPDTPQARARARTIMAALIGTVAMARAIDDPELSDRLLDDARKSLAVMAAAPRP